MSSPKEQGRCVNCGCDALRHPVYFPGRPAQAPICTGCRKCFAYVDSNNPKR